MRNEEGYKVSDIIIRRTNHLELEFQEAPQRLRFLAVIVINGRLKYVFSEDENKVKHRAYKSELNDSIYNRDKPYQIVDKILKREKLFKEDVKVLDELRPLLRKERNDVNGRRRRKLRLRTPLFRKEESIDEG